MLALFVRQIKVFLSYHFIIKTIDLSVSLSQRQCNWTKASRSDFDTFSPNDHSKTLDYNVQITDHEKTRAGFTDRVTNNCANGVSHSGQKWKTNHSMNQQQQRKCNQRQKGQQHEQGRPQNRARSHPTKSSRKPEARTEPRKQMKDRNKSQVRFLTVTN